MISKFFAAVVIAAAGVFAGLFTGLAAPASAACAPGFTSIPCTIADNVSKAPSQLAGQNCPDDSPSGTCGLAGAPQQFSDAVGALPGEFAKGAQTPANLVGVNCPPKSPQNTCGLTGAPGQFFGPGGGLEQIVTAPQTIAGALANAPGQFTRAIQNGGSDPESQ
ncbi:hypothetical protein [Mycobacterium sp. NPDC006124]|uniref:hypothetical protein n=1 Tax=Mycobacterium sp. NPDC006124 TaxID=3156729 RepID=UPI0033AEA217